MEKNKFLNINDEKAFNELLDALKSEEAILFVGAGCSSRLGYPSWKDLIRGLVLLCGNGVSVDEERLKNDIIKYAGEVKQKLFELSGNSNSRYENHLTRTFKTPDDEYKEKDTELHQLICSWPIKAYITTNYDKALEFFLRKNNPQIEGIVTSNKAILGNFLFSLKENRCKQEVLHLHGIYSDTSSIILTDDEYSKAYDDKIEKVLDEDENSYKVSKPFSVQRAIQKNILWTLLSTRRVVFIGFGMEDEYFVKMLSSVSRDLWDFDQTKHFAIMPFSEDVDKGNNSSEFKKEEHSCWTRGEIFKKDYGVQAIFYPNSDQTFRGLLDLVKYLNEEIIKQVVIKQEHDEKPRQVSDSQSRPSKEEMLHWARNLQQSSDEAEV